MLLGFIDEGLQGVTERMEPLAEVDDLGVAEGELLFEVEGVALDGELFEGLVGLVQDGAAGGFVGASGFHADEAVLDHDDLSDGVLAAEGVESLDEDVTGEFLAVDGDGVSCAELDGEGFWDVWRVVNIRGHEPDVGVDLLVGMLDLGAFVRAMPEVTVAGVDFGLGLSDGDAFFLGVFDGGLAAGEFEGWVFPWGDNLEVWSESHVGEFKADLVVALSGGAVRDGVGSGFACRGDLPLGDEGSGDGCAEEVVLLVDCVGTQHGEAVEVGELFAEVFDDELVGTGLSGFLFDAVEFAGSLAEISRIGDEFDTGVAILEPGEDDGGVKPAGVGQDDLSWSFRGGVWHHADTIQALTGASPSSDGVLYMRSTRFVVGALLACSYGASVQAQLRVAQWNITNYGSGRTADFRTAIYDSFQGRSMNPDVIIAEEVQSESGAINFRNILNSYPGGPTDWTYATFIDFAGDTDNALFYRTSKVTFLDVTTLSQNTGSGAGQAPRPNQRYRVRLNGYSSAGAEMYLYASHMKAGSTPGDRDRRTPEAQRLRDDAEALPTGSAFILGGDFNIQSWNETAYQILVSSMVNNSGRFFDPIKSPGSATPAGNWNANNNYRFIHTQDPATCDAACGAGCGGGGMDDRFDQLLVSNALIDGNGLEYVGNANVTYSTTTWNDPNHSYRCWGNDGTSFNCRLNTTTNAMVGPAIAQALVNAANGLGHLPVYMDVQVPAKVSSVTNVNFGTVLVGSVATQTIQISNSVSVSQWSRAGNGTGIDNLDYTLSTTAGFIAPAGAFSASAGVAGNTHVLGMSTATPGMKMGTLTIASDDPDQPTRLVMLTGNVVTPSCPCDWNMNGTVTSQDFFDFIGDFFAGNADYNHSGSTTSQDFFDFLVCFLGGC